VDDFHHLMLEPDSASRHAMVTDLGITLVGDRGWSALTPASLGQALGLTRQAVHRWFGDQHTLRLVFARQFCGRWERWIDVRVHAYGFAGLLPRSDQSRRWARVWLALVEQAGRDGDFGAVVRHARRSEAEVLARRLATLAREGHGVALSPTPRFVMSLQAGVEGLRVRACQPGAPDEVHACLEEVAYSAVETLVGARCLTSSKSA
jgi:hypothetical protein